MYTAYIIQRFPIVIGMYLCILVFEASNNLVGSEYTNDTLLYIIPANMVIPAFLFMVAFFMLVTWPLAYGTVLTQYVSDRSTPNSVTLPMSIDTTDINLLIRSNLQFSKKKGKTFARRGQG